jgi:hypothetical protein
MMPENICLLNGSFKMGYRWKGHTRLQKAQREYSLERVPIWYDFRLHFKVLKTRAL